MKTSTTCGKPTWFDRGVRAFAQLGLALPEYYVCPLCRHGYTRETIAALTREHVPPKALGGRPLVLTCRRCNHNAGGKNGVDTSAAHIDRLRRFGKGTLGKPLNASMEFDGLNLNVELSKTEKHLEIAGLPNSNPPGTCDVFKTRLESLEASKRTDWKFKLSLPTIRPRPGYDRISWLRTAYLAAFASLGYRYALRSVLDQVRAQIATPNIKSLDFYYFTPRTPLAPAPGLMLVNLSQITSAVFVSFDDFFIALPFSDNDHDFYTKLRKGLAKDESVRFEGKFLPWPTEPEHCLDLCPPRELQGLVAEIEGTSTGAPTS